MIFQTDFDSVHGFTDPVKGPRYRNSIALYYYTAADRSLQRRHHDLLASAREALGSRRAAHARLPRVALLRAASRTSRTGSIRTA